MFYPNIVQGKFIDRPNRFIAVVEINGQREMVHVKNTGRCRELLIPRAVVYLQYTPSPNRKTDYSLIAVKKGASLINIDSQVPNKVVYDGILSGKIDALRNPFVLKREVMYQSSRFDMFFESNTRKGFIEVKGVTLENNGIALFPDAPTKRGTRHVLEMIHAVESGYEGYIVFLIQMKGIESFKANERTDPEFAKALRLAVQNKVKILAYDCNVSKDSIEISEQVDYKID